MTFFIKYNMPQTLFNLDNSKLQNTLLTYHDLQPYKSNISSLRNKFDLNAYAMSSELTRKMTRAAKVSATAAHPNCEYGHRNIQEPVRAAQELV